MDVYTLSGMALSLQEPALKAGGEGAIHVIGGYPKKLAKIYFDKNEAKQREDKVCEMIRLSKDANFRAAGITENVAWPLSPIFDDQYHFIGFGMNRIESDYELDDMYVYPPQENASLTMKEKVDTLVSLCDVTDKIHSIDQVVGDFNPNNIKVRRDGTVAFVDADSYHVHSSGKEFRCIVCAPGYVAPEVVRACAGTTYADCPGQTFTKETDRFGLAIHCFRMLMNGCHPYMLQREVRTQGSAPAPKSMDKRVEAGETPFFTKVKDYTVPAYAPDIYSLPPYLYSLFKKAFVDSNYLPRVRPTAADWKKNLERYQHELKECRQDPSHYYWKGNKTCPYCEAEKRRLDKLRETTGAKIPPKQPKFKPRAAQATAGGILQPQKKNNIAYWWTTLILAALILFPMASELLFPIYNSILDNPLWIDVATWGSIAFGMLGCVLYNCLWAKGRRIGRYRWYEFCLSPIYAMFFAMSFGVVALIVGVILYILGYFLSMIFTATFAAAVYGG